MVLTSSGNFQAQIDSEYDRKTELKAFDDLRIGVKGLVDAGIRKIPRIFIHPQYDRPEKSGQALSQSSFPFIDLDGVNNGGNLRAKIINEVQNASGSWGFFQVINHRIQTSVLEEMIDGIRRFHELDSEVKKEYYTRDLKKRVLYVSNFGLFQAPAGNWKDTLACIVAPDPPDPMELPAVCRDIVMEYLKQVQRLGYTLFELLSEALGLNVNHLNEMKCGEGIFLQGHYYPVCPEPELTFGARKHTDHNFLTVLLQDQMGGLQVLHENQWVDVPPMPGALVINIGDLLQVITNEKFKSVEHRVLANSVGSRVSVASAIGTSFSPSSRLYGPIKELVSEENPPKYKEATLRDHIVHFKGLRV